MRMKLGLLLFCLCVLCALPAMADDVLWLDGVQYHVSSDHAVPVYFADDAETIVLHAMVEGVPVDVQSYFDIKGGMGVRSLIIGEGITFSSTHFLLKWAEQLEHISIPGSMKTVPSGYLARLTNLQSITLGEGIVSIEAESLGGAIRRIALPASVRGVHAKAFSHCTAITHIEVHADNKVYTSRDGVLYTKDLDALVMYPPYREEKQYAVLPGTRVIRSGAFYCAWSLEEIIMPEGVKALEGSPFASSRCLVSITLPSTARDIGEYAFWDIPSLLHVDISKDNVWYESIEGVLFLRKRRALVAYPKGRQGSYSIPSETEAISRKAFVECKGLTNLTIPEGITELSDYMLEGCTALESITLPETLTKMDDHVFSDLVRLKHINVPEGNPVFTSIDGVLFKAGGQVLYRYPSGRIGSFEMPAGTIEIDKDAFGLNRAMTHLRIPEGLEVLEKDVLQQCAALQTIHLPASLHTIHDKQSFPVNLKRVEVAEESEIFYSVDGILYERKTGDRILYPNAYAEHVSLAETDLPDTHGNSTIKTLTLSKATTDIEKYAFNRYVSLERVMLPFGLRTIGEGAFNSCLKLDHIAFPPFLEAIGRGAFWDCQAISSIYLPDSVKYIGERAFDGCISMETVRLPKGLKRIESGTFAGCQSLASIELPEGLHYIGTDAFRGTAISALVIPDSVASIASNAFEHMSEDFVLYAPYASEGFYAAQESDLLWAEKPGDTPCRAREYDPQLTDGAINTPNPDPQK